MKIDRNNWWSVKENGLVVGFCFYFDENKALEKVLKKFSPEPYNVHYKGYRKKLKKIGSTLFFKRDDQYEVEKAIRNFKDD